MKLNRTIYAIYSHTRSGWYSNHNRGWVAWNPFNKAQLFHSKGAAKSVLTRYSKLCEDMKIIELDVIGDINDIKAG